nr:stage VI sporulation protein D [Neobacillus rhizosphaerae]
MKETKGGVALSQENQSCLRFSLEESLWFRKGQEVEELVSISLDPDITIQENDQYVTIRGSLELTGEYKSYEAADEGKDEGFTSQKFVERVADLDEGNCEFSHRFPVDITIPNNRIQSIYDIDVLVESFDYSLPERSCLKLSAELTISGLYGIEQQQQLEQTQEYEVLHRTEEEAAEEEVEVEQEVVPSSHEDNFLFEVEVRKQQEEESIEVLPKFPTFNYQPQVEYVEEDYEPAWDLQEARSESSQPIEIEHEVVFEEESVPNPHFEEEVTILEESSSSSDDVIKKVKKKLSGKKKSMTLTEFFARKDESSAHAKLKVCIVQKGDTLDGVAERYDVTVPNLLRVNNLELNQDIYEGQVLYIPATFAKK